MNVRFLIAVIAMLAAPVFAASTQDISPYPLGERSIFSDRATAERLAPVGAVAVEGEEVAGEEAPAEPRAGDVVYNAVCAACHSTGAAGAPIVGDVAQWSSRISKGMSVLIDSGINGIGAMPGKGGCASCMDEEIQAAVEHMVNQSK